MAEAILDTSTATGHGLESNGLKQRIVNGIDNGKVNGNYANGHIVQTMTEEVKATEHSPKKVRIKRKYRHVAAIHAEPKASCLSHDAEVTPSFVGFRNLMVLVLVVGNLRLMIENFKKVSANRLAYPITI